MPRELRVVMVDDSVIYRKILSLVLEGIKGVRLIGEFSDGKSGLEGIKQLNPDIVLLDVEMPGMNGLELLKIIRRDFPSTGVIMVSGASQKHANITVAALELGAIDFVPKPSEGTLEENVNILQKKLSPLIHLFSTQRNLDKIRQITEKMSSIGRKDEVIVKTSNTQDIKSLPYPIDIVALGISTGGPYALNKVIPEIPADFPVPIVIVQHMPPNFTASLANSLDKKSNLTVLEASDGDVLEAGKVYIAPGGRHMVISMEGKGKEKAVLRMQDTPPVHGCRPSVDVLFYSIAENFPGNVLAVIMTGMGSDGAAGVEAMKKKNCYCLIQDEASCVVFGMPKAVYERNLADEVLPLDKLANRIVELVELSRKEIK